MNWNWKPGTAGLQNLPAQSVNMDRAFAYIHLPDNIGNILRYALASHLRSEPEGMDRLCGGGTKAFIDEAAGLGCNLRASTARTDVETGVALPFIPISSVTKSTGSFMYTALKHSHVLTAVLSLLITLIWAAIAWKRRPGPIGQLAGKTRGAYIGLRAITGLAGITGLAVTFLGPWKFMVFPYIGLAAFLIHGFAATVSKRTFADSQKNSTRRTALLIQIVALLLSAYVMAVKSF